MLFTPCNARVLRHNSRLNKCYGCGRRDWFMFRKLFSTNNGEKVETTSTSIAGGYGRIRDPMLPTSQELPRGELFRHCDHPKTVSIVGAPLTYGQPFDGTDFQPSLLRQAGLLSMLSSLGWRVKDSPDMNFGELENKSSNDHPNAKNSQIVGHATSQIADRVESTITNGQFPLILGGDHSIGIGSLAGILRCRPNVGVLWIDAHADLNTPSTSMSGNMHGMPLGLLTEGILSSPQERSQIPGLEWLASTDNGPIVALPSDSIVYVGLRDVDEAERIAIRKHSIVAYTMYDIDRYGIGTVMEMALHHLLKDDPDRPLHVSYDIDAIDPVLAPATGTTVRGGLTFREAHYVAESVAVTGNLASAELVEMNPNLSDGSGAKETVDLGLQIITSLMGKSII